MTKKIRKNPTSPSVLEALRAATRTLDPSLMPSHERASQRSAPGPSFSVHQRVAPQRITSFASRRRHK